MVWYNATRRAMLVTTGSAALLGTAGVVSAVNLEVETDGASNVTSDSATLHGTLHGLGDSDTVYVQFACGEDLTDPIHYTNHEAMSETGSFSHDVTHLNSCTTYYYYARVESEDGSTVDTGQTLDLTTSGCSGGGGGPGNPDPE